jgi:CelD/BcsL family acetyltransferase involved in cellulose biosynthesis
VNISILNPLDHPNWDSLLLTNDRTTFFHSAAWARVLSESYGYKPLYFTLIAGERLAGLIPVMEIKSYLTGKRGVSLPFTDFCPLVAECEEVFAGLLDAVFAHGRKAGWKTVEFRGAGNFLASEPACAGHLIHELVLDPDESKVFASFKTNTRRNARKASEKGLSVSILRSRRAMDEFVRLNGLTRKRHGLPPQPAVFFKNVFEQIIYANKGFVALASYKELPVAAAVYFFFKEEAIYKYGASDHDYQNLRPNNLVMWEAIRWCCQNNFRSFNFGRTEPDNGGLLQFKRAWGTVEHKLRYFKYDLNTNRFVAGQLGAKTSYRVFKVMPIPVLRLAGNLLYRHVG